MIEADPADAWPVAPPIPRPIDVSEDASDGDRPATPRAPVRRGSEPTTGAAGRAAGHGRAGARRPVADARSIDPDQLAAGERSIIERAQAGDRDAFRELYEANVATVLSFLARRVGPQASEDLASETFAKAFERLDRFEWRGVPFRAWLLRIAYHEVVARSRRRSSSEVTTDDPRPAPSEGHEDDVVDHLAMSTSLAAALSSLGAQQRLAVELRYLRGLSVTETSEVLGIGPEAVRALTYRSLTSLRAAMT